MRRRAGIRAIVLAAAMLLLVPACGADTAAENGAGTPSSATIATTTTTGTTSTTPTKKQKKKNVIAWILSLGPGAPDGPPEFTAYRELQQLRCRQVFDRVEELDEPARTLYVGSADACLAALEGRTERWARATAALEELGGRTDELTCMDRAALALLDRLVTLHRQHPSRTFRAASTTQSKAPPCPRIGGLVPDRGIEGTLVRMTGTHLGADVVGISVIDSLGNSLPAERGDGAGDAIEFTMPEAPPSEASASVCVVVRADPDWVADGRMFTYESGTNSPPTTFDCPPAAEG